MPFDLRPALETGNDWRRYEKPDTAQRIYAEERRQAARDRDAYAEYVQLVQVEQQRTPPLYQVAPLSFDEWSAFLSSDDEPSVRGQLATHRALAHRINQTEHEAEQKERDEARTAIADQQRDPGWRMPNSAFALSMTIEKGFEFARTQGALFVEHNPDYYPTKANYEAIANYLKAQGIKIPDEECLKRAWLRLREFNLLEERPVETPASPQPEPQSDPDELKRQKRDEYRNKIVVTDPRNGEGLTEYQLDRLPADEYKRLMLGEFRTPRMSDVIKPAWYRDRLS